jgi:hypothetical protein
MPWVGTPEASQEPRPHGYCASAFPVGRAGRLLHYGSISGLCIPFTCVPAYDLPVYASPGTLPYPTQDSVPDCWRGFVRAAISDGWTFCACKAQLPPHRTCRSRIRRFGRFSMPSHAKTLAGGSPQQHNARSGLLPCKRPVTRLYDRSGLPCVAAGTLPSADSSHAVREDSSSLSQFPWHATSRGT